MRAFEGALRLHEVRARRALCASVMIYMRDVMRARRYAARAKSGAQRDACGDALR